MPDQCVGQLVGDTRVIIPDDDPGICCLRHVAECETEVITAQVASCIAVEVGQPITTFHDLIRQDVTSPSRT